MPIQGRNQLDDQTMGKNFEEAPVSDFDSQEVWTGNRLQSTIGRRAMGPAYTFILPDLYQFPDGFRQFLERDMIEMPTLRRLEQSGHLNWWCVNSTQKLYPLVTTGDGNCLLHAASLGTWGVHDRQLHLRETLYNVLKNGSRRHAFWRRWRWSESKMNLQSELVLSEEEWTKEWNDVLQMAAPTPRTSQISEPAGNCSDGPSKSHSTEQIYESLETVHVFALAHILKRPIVIVSDTVLRNANGEELSPIPFGGIYLPLECPPEQCHRSPLVLCYDSSHFSALVAMRSTNNSCLPAIPIMDKNRNILPVHFAIDPSPDFTWWKDSEDNRIAAELDAQMTEDFRLELIARYMDVVKMDLRRGSIKKMLPFVSSENPMIPTKLMTLASGGGDYSDKSNPNRIMKEIRNHFKKLGSLGKKDKIARRFSAAELRQSNCILTALLHNFAHQYTDSMVDNYISGARRRFEEMRTLSTNFTPKNRMSRSFSSSSVLLTCLNTHCDKTASPSTNFLCPVCFEDQKREMAYIGTANNQSLNCNSQIGNQYAGLYASYKNSNGTNKKSNTMPVISTTMTDGERNNVSIASTDIYFDSEPEEFDYEEDLIEREKEWNVNGSRINQTEWNMNGSKIDKKENEFPPPVPPRRASGNKFPINRTNIHITPGTAHCHNGNSPNISATKMAYQYAATKS
ncbi:hypothetical protein FO519_008647 [Halicephalobus sp. NKZ332]|nr:hypothetical protein FO519_008647 [Halicephalobus sp. NKZ332]